MAGSRITHEDLGRHAEATRRRSALITRRVLRGIGVLGIMAVLGGAAYVLLSWLVPLWAPGAPSGGLVLCPPSKLVLAVSWYSPVLTALLIVPRWMRRGRERDVRDGLILPEDEAGRKPRTTVGGWLIYGVFAGGVLVGAWLLFHMYTVIGPEGIRVQRGGPSVTDYSYQRVRRVQVNRTGRVLPNYAPDAPSCRVEFDDGSGLVFDTDQGLTLEELERTAAEIAGRAGVVVSPTGLDARR